MNQANIRNRDIVSSLPLLASVLGRNYGVKVEIGGGSAYTDGNVIHIPSLPLDCDTELLHLARGYLDHESAHIRHTDFTALQNANLDAVTKHLWNSIEDWRVEEKLSQIYPGCRQHFHWLARKVFLEDADISHREAGSPSANPASLVLEYVLLTVRSWAVAELSDKRQVTALTIDRTFDGLRRQLDAVLGRIQTSCQTTDDAIRFAQELATILKQWQSEQTEQEGGSNRDSEQSPGNDARQKGKGGNGQEPPIDKNQNAKDGSDAIGGTSSIAKANGEEEVVESDCDLERSGNRQVCQPTSDPESCIRDLFNCDEADLPKSLGEHLADRLEGEREPRKETSITVATVGKTSLCNIGVEEKEEALRASCALRSRLQGLLQASTRKHVGSARRGTLATKSLYRLSIGSPRIFQYQDESQGLSTAIHLLLDVSSSMSGQAIKLARQSCYAVLKALSGIKGINPAVTAYPAFDLEDSVVPLALHGKPIPPYLNVQACGSTPLAQALWWVMQEMLPLKENRKIILILTDGIPDSVPAAQSAIETAEKIGFEIFGLGMHLRVIRDFLPRTSKVIYSLNDLPNALFGLLQQTLVPTM